MSFKSNVKAAVATVALNLECQPLRTQRLYTPYWNSGAYEWMSPMDSDGLLVAERGVSGGLPGAIPVAGWAVPPLRLGVVVQVEEATGGTKPNPFGKASVVNVPLGLWVDRYDPYDRVRLDHVWVLFVTRSDMTQVHKNLHVVTTANPASWTIKFDPKASAQAMAAKIEGEVRGFLKGRGRPKNL